MNKENKWEKRFDEYFKENIYITVPTDMDVKIEKVKSFIREVEQSAYDKAIEEAKEAFYEVFSGAGELWFNYGDDTTKEERDSYVDNYWNEFSNNLNKLKNK